MRISEIIDNAEKDLCVYLEHYDIYRFPPADWALSLLAP